MPNTNNFKYLFWFCVGVFVCSFAAMMTLLFIEIPDANREMASNAQGFLQGSLIMAAVGYLLQGSINTLQKKIPEPGNTSIDLSLNATTKEDEKTGN